MIHYTKCKYLKYKYLKIVQHLSICAYLLLISATCLHVCPCANRTISTCKNMPKSSSSGQKLTRGAFKWKSKVLKIFFLINIFYILYKENSYQELEL